MAIYLNASRLDNASLQGLYIRVSVLFPKFKFNFKSPKKASHCLFGWKTALPSLVYYAQVTRLPLNSRSSVGSTSMKCFGCNFTHHSCIHSSYRPRNRWCNGSFLKEQPNSSGFIFRHLLLSWDLSLKNGNSGHPLAISNLSTRKALRQRTEFPFLVSKSAKLTFDEL